MLLRTVLPPFCLHRSYPLVLQVLLLRPHHSLCRLHRRRRQRGREEHMRLLTGGQLLEAEQVSLLTLDNRRWAALVEEVCRV